MSVIISHTSVAPFIQQAALALDEGEVLDRFITTVCYQPDALWQQIVFKSGKMIGLDLEREFKRRTASLLPEAKIEKHPTRELLRLLAAKIDRSGRLADRVWSWSEPSFDRLVSRKLKPGIRAVYGYEFSSYSSFQRARSLGINTIYDVPAPETQTVQRILNAEMEKFPVLRNPYRRHTQSREATRAARRKAEWQSADVIVAASQFTKSSYISVGIEPEKILVVPYGSPPCVSATEAESGGTSIDTPLQLLWAGTFNVRKGAHYLLDAWRTHNLEQIAELKVFGANVLPESLQDPLPPGIQFQGSIPRDELMTHYHASDVLVFPTLCDGFGMVATEAWSRGLPVLTTLRAGASDLLRDKENGLLCQPGNPDSLAEAIRWCAENRGHLRRMRPLARETAATWQWSDYRSKLRESLSPFLRATKQK